MNPFSAFDQAVRDLFSSEPRDRQKEDELLRVEALEPRILYSASPLSEAPVASRESTPTADIRLIQESTADAAIITEALQPPSIEVKE